jgi:small GTP-binding protein
MKKTKMQNYDYLFKLLIIGDSGVGKTCLLSSYTEENFDNSNYLTTIGIDLSVKLLTCLDRFIKLQIWDTAGQERFRTITNNYYHGADGVIIVYDVTERNTFENVKMWLKTINEKAKQDVYKILIGNKIDKSDRVIEYDEGLRLARENNMSFYETSSKYVKNISFIFNSVAENLLTKMIKFEEIKETCSFALKKFSSAGIEKEYFCCI